MPDVATKSDETHKRTKITFNATLWERTNYAKHAKETNTCKCQRAPCTLQYVKRTGVIQQLAKKHTIQRIPSLETTANCHYSKKRYSSLEPLLIHAQLKQQRGKWRPCECPLMSKTTPGNDIWINILENNPQTKNKTLGQNQKNHPNSKPGTIPKTKRQQKKNNKTKEEKQQPNMNNNKNAIAKSNISY